MDYIPGGAVLIDDTHPFISYTGSSWRLQEHDKLGPIDSRAVFNHTTHDLLIGIGSVLFNYTGRGFLATGLFEAPDGGRILSWLCFLDGKLLYNSSAETGLRGLYGLCGDFYADSPPGIFYDGLVTYRGEDQANTWKKDCQDWLGFVNRTRVSLFFPLLPSFADGVD